MTPNAVPVAMMTVITLSTVSLAFIRTYSYFIRE